MDVFLNGKFVAAEQAHVSISDAGFQHAVGLFETMQAFNGRVFRLGYHLDRLAWSARTLGLTPRLETERLAEAVRRTLEHNQLERCRLRLTLTAGDVAMRSPSADNSSTDHEPEAGPSEPDRPAGEPIPTLAIVPSEPTLYDPAYFEQGVTVLVAPPAANPFDDLAGHKTLSYWGRLRTLRQAASAGAGEAIWLNVSHHLASGAVSNIFLVKDGRLLTPIARGEETPGALSSPVLPGTTRRTLLELADAQGLFVEKKMLSVEDMLEADEVFLTNAGWHVLPVTRVEQREIADNAVGPITRRLRQTLLETIELETRQVHE